MKLTIVIPIFNEADSLPTLLSEIDAEANPGVNFLIVDNGSTDIAIEALLAKKGRNWKAIRTNPNIGFGGAIALGITSAAADASWVGWMPGNLKPDLTEFFQKLTVVSLTSATAIKFRRVGRARISALKTACFGLIQSIFAGQNLMDSGGTPTIVPTALALRIVAARPPSDFRFESFALLFMRATGVKVDRPKLAYRERKFGASHWQSGLFAEFWLLKNTISELSQWHRRIREVGVANDSYNSAS